MTIFVVTHDDMPLRTTRSEREACAAFDRLVGSHRFRQAGVFAITADRGRRVLREAWQDL